MIFLFVFLVIYQVYALENGLARTPPMGWMSWTRFFCELDCVKYPKGCINENLYMDMADRMAQDGYRDVGYEFVHIDDCWMANKRDANGKLVPNATRFPSGIPALADYMHQRGLKLGIYEDYGTYTCMGYPGSYGHIETDAQTFADWKVDYLKFDGCNINTDMMPIGYPEMSQALLKTGRPIVYSCSWPAYLVDEPQKVNYTQIGASCNLWRNFVPDIRPNWTNIIGIIDYYTQNQDKLIAANRPGGWNDPDMIVIGDPGLTVDQARAQMTMWSIWSAPLIMSNDLRDIDLVSKEILLNTRVIAVDQDPLGIMGRKVATIGLVNIYVKKMTPCNNDQSVCSYAVAILNKGTKSVTASFKLNNIGLDYTNGYNILDLWDGVNMGLKQPSDSYQTTVNATGVHFIKATPTFF